MSVLNYEDAVDRITRAVQENYKGYVCVTGMHGILEARDRPGFREILNRAFLCTPDGMPGVWVGRLSGHRNHDRVYGPDLMLAVMQATQHKPIRHFFYGGNEGVAEELKRTMEERFPGLSISGTYCPPFRPLTEEERVGLRTELERVGADIVWVGLSTPKQELFMAENLDDLPVKVMIGVGAAFDFHTGRARQAPYWMQRSGLEWLFRLVTEPKRLWKRYCVGVPRLLALLALRVFSLIWTSPTRPGKLLSLVPWLGLPVLASLILVGVRDVSALAVYGLSLVIALLSVFVTALILMAQTAETRLKHRSGQQLAVIVFYLAVFSWVVGAVSPLILFSLPHPSLLAWTTTALSLVAMLFQPLRWVVQALIFSRRKA